MVAMAAMPSAAAFTISEASPWRTTNSQVASTIPGTNGAAGSGRFAGLPGRIGQAITNAINNGVSNRFTNIIGAFGYISPATQPPVVSNPQTVLDSTSAQPAAADSVATAEDSTPAESQATLIASSEGTSSPALSELVGGLP